MKKLLLLLCCFLFLFTACQKPPALLDSVSELRLDILKANSEQYDLTVHVSNRESPYLSDGICGDLNAVAEFYLTVPNRSGSYTLSFTAEGKEHTAELSFSSVHLYYYALIPVDLSHIEQLPCTITHEDGKAELTCRSVKTDSTLPYTAILDALLTTPEANIDALIEGNRFLGEIYLRLVYDESCFYYVGITDRDQNTCSLLFDGNSGKLLAVRNQKGQ